MVSGEACDAGEARGSTMWAHLHGVFIGVSLFFSYTCTNICVTPIQARPNFRRVGRQFLAVLHNSSMAEILGVPAPTPDFTSACPYQC